MNIPDGQEIDYDNSTIVYKPIRKSLAWEDLGNVRGVYVNDRSNMYPCYGRADRQNANIYHTEEQAQASIAQAKLTQVMAVANGDWVVDWKDEDQVRWCITLNCDNEFSVRLGYQFRAFLSFKTRDLAKQAMEDNAQILEEYKPLAGG